MCHDMLAMATENGLNQCLPAYGYQVDGFCASLQHPTVSKCVDECLTEIAATSDVLRAPGVEPSPERCARSLINKTSLHIKGMSVLPTWDPQRLIDRRPFVAALVGGRKQGKSTAQQDLHTE